MITTIIPTYRRPKSLQRAVQSVLNQSISDIQILVLDDCSQDGTAQLVAEWSKRDARITLCSHKNNLGSIANFQFGLDQVKTPYCSILADDDLLLPNFYNTALSALIPEARFFWGSVIEVDEQGHVISANASKWKREGILNPSESLPQVIKHYVNWTGVLFRTEIAQSIRLDPEVEALDFDFMARLAARYPFVFSKTPCALFVQHSASYSITCGLKLFWPGWKKTTQTLIAQAPHTEALMKSCLKRNLRNLAIRSFARGQHKEAEEVLNIYAKEFSSFFSYILLSCRIPLAMLFRLVRFWRKKRHETGFVVPTDFDLC